jgi:hypothetical protein
MNQQTQIYPRELTQREKNWLFTMLPEDRPGYKNFRNKISNSVVIGEGRFGEGNFILGNKGDEPDYTISSAPVFAVGQIFCDNCTIDVIIHEEDEGQIEVDISTLTGNKPPEKAEMKSYHTYSEWKPGDSAPGDEAQIREVHLVKNEIVLAIAPSHKKIWVYDNSYMVNHFIPVSNFYNEIMKFDDIKDPKIALDPKRLFNKTNEFSDKEIIAGFISYNKQWKRISLDYSQFEEKKPARKKSIFNIFKRRS